MTFTGGVWKVTKRAMVVARGNISGTLYMTSSCYCFVNINLDL